MRTEKRRIRQEEIQEAIKRQGNPQWTFRDHDNKKLFGLSIKLDDDWCTLMIDFYQPDKKTELIHSLRSLKQQFQDAFKLPVQVIDAKDLTAQMTSQLRKEKHQTVEVLDIMTGEFISMELNVKKL